MPSAEEAHALPSLQELARGLQQAAVALLPFLQIAIREPLRAEALVLEVLLVSLEREWICFDLESASDAAKDEFREEMFGEAWKRICAEIARTANPSLGTYSENRMPFFRLDLDERAALYLRTRAKFTYEEIQRILSLPDREMGEDLVQRARCELLGHDWHEDTSLSVVAQFDGDADDSSKGSRFDV